MAATITYDREKFEELLLYVAERSVGDPNFGKTKLNKILFYIDFLAYGTLGKPVTGATYQRRPKGPVPREIIDARQALIDRNEIDLIWVERFGYRQERMIAKRPASIEIFTGEEIDLINDVIDAMKDMNATGASALSHREPGWRIAGERETIPYEAVFLAKQKMTDDDVRRGQEIQRILDKEIPIYA